jgi:hypothetical protein
LRRETRVRNVLASAGIPDLVRQERRENWRVGLAGTADKAMSKPDLYARTVSLILRLKGRLVLRTSLWCSGEQKKRSSPASKHLEQRFFVSVPHTRHCPIVCEVIGSPRKLLSWWWTGSTSGTDEVGESMRDGVGGGVRVSTASQDDVAG